MASNIVGVDMISNLEYLFVKCISDWPPCKNEHNQCETEEERYWDVREPNRNIAPEGDEPEKCQQSSDNIPRGTNCSIYEIRFRFVRHDNTSFLRNFKSLGAKRLCLL